MLGFYIITVCSFSCHKPSVHLYFVLYSGLVLALRSMLTSHLSVLPFTSLPPLKSPMYKDYIYFPVNCKVTETIFYIKNSGQHRGGQL